MRLGFRRHKDNDRIQYTKQHLGVIPRLYCHLENEKMTTA